jgi:alginate O-acetyltransferase complex protein AlgF
MNRRVILILCCLLAAAGLAGILAGADTLYGTQAPKDAAFVRVFRAVEGGEALEIGARRFAPPRGGVTPYRPVLPDIYLLRAGGRELELIPKIRRYYTLVLTAEGLRVFEDVEHTDPARAQLVLYNLLPGEPVELKTADGRTPVIAAVAPGQAGRVSVNPVPVQLAAFGAGGAAVVLGDPGLRRGASYSVFVFPGGSGPQALCAKAELAKD